MRVSTKAWIGLGTGVFVWEMLCPRDEMLSHGYDYFLQKHPVLTWTATIATALHLLNVMPSRIDAWRLVGLLRETPSGIR